MTSLENRDIQYIKGVGPRRADLFRRLGAGTVGALLRLYPRAYEDWSHPISISDAPLNEGCCVKATALTRASEHRIRKGMTLYKFRATDGESMLYVTLFNSKFAADKIHAGVEYLFYGKLTGSGRRREMSSPAIEPADGSERLRAVYPATEGLSSRIIETAVANALSLLGELADDPLPDPLRREYSLCHLRYALNNIHRPESEEALAVARRRLVFEELLTLQLGLLRLKQHTRGQGAPVLPRDCSDEFFSLLPFSPTGAQRRCVREALRDMAGRRPMSRLLQGDVGSGKTVVAAALCHSASKNGWQSALMAPTGILAVQHYHSIAPLLEKAGLTCALLTGATKASEKQRIRDGLISGEIDFVVGTHALLQDDVAFQRLGLVVTDEQHRFGVAQRSALAQKGQSVHMLVMSATPIPRTLALMIYGDLDVSILDELPPGRQKIDTFAVRSDKRARVFAFVKRHLEEGRQAYIVCPLVEEGPEGLMAAEQYAAKLMAKEFAGYRVGLLHGRLKNAQKEQVMLDFSENRISLLIATTVIEVGVDVPNATVMVVENAERFGLSQLHQLRGRIGRGQHPSTCVLISDAKNEEAVRRLKAMCRTQSGFELAEEDLKLRGPGDFFGRRQHGLPALKIADLSGDMALLHAAQKAAGEILSRDPLLQAPENRPLSELVDRLFAQIGDGGIS
ncbi:MAG: ATP-dependent DNA helicase RecG [Clostridiales bacterium]|nr:ATP-dependent DNA helicase RecG [Clostridiales bacterium]